jgi:hypothetical protein
VVQRKQQSAQAKIASPVESAKGVVSFSKSDFKKKGTHHPWKMPLLARPESSSPQD